MGNTYEIRAEKFIHQIFDYIDGCKQLSQFEKAVRRFNADHNRKVKFAHGLTRVCFITSDYVIKYDFGTERNLGRFGTCRNEVQTYALAERDGFAYLLAKPTMIEYKEKWFCIMPRINGIEKYSYDVNYYLTNEENDWVSDHIYDLHNGNYGWKNRHPVIIDYACR